MDPLSLVRPNILALEPYSTARDEFSGGDIDVFVDANESPYENGINRYPDPRQKQLKSVISKIKGVPAERIFLGNGSDEAIDLVYRIFCRPGIDNTVMIAPSYGMYSVAAATNDIKVRFVNLEEDFSLDTEKFLAAADQNTKVGWICSPNNPTGNAFPVSQIEEILRRFNGILVVDEAYIDFSSEESVASLIDKYPQLIVLQTMSKAWGMAGIRLGIAFSTEKVNEIFGRVKYPYNINILAQRTALGKINEQQKKRHVEEILKERERLADGIKDAACVKRIYPSDANFILVKVDDANAWYDRLVSQGIIVRNRTRVVLCKDCLRITVGTPEENNKTIAVLNGKPLPEASERHAIIHRQTRETDITVEIDLDRRQAETDSVSTGLCFLDHMLMQIPHHGGIALNVKAIGDLEVDEHHTMEDVAIVLGEAIDKALGSKLGIGRYGFVLPMDDCDAMVLMDFGGRIDFRWDVEFTRDRVGDVPTEMFEHFFQSLASAMKVNMHIKAVGTNDHHKAESIFKAFARALRMAVSRSQFPYELPSSKGLL